MKTPEYIRFIKCHGTADKKFLVGTIKKGKPTTRKERITYSAARGLLNTAIFNDIQKLCLKEEEGFQRNTCHSNEVKKVRNSLGVE